MNAANHVHNVAEKSDGFLTVQYTVDCLQDLVRKGSRPIVALDPEGNLVGYVILVTRQMVSNGLLLSLVEAADQDGLLKDSNYIIIAQLCVAPSARGKKLPGMLYDFVSDLHGERYPLAIAEIAQQNERSLNAHTKLGWNVRLDSGYSFKGIDWIVVVQEIPFLHSRI